MWGINIDMNYWHYLFKNHVNTCQLKKKFVTKHAVQLLEVCEALYTSLFLGVSSSTRSVQLSEAEGWNSDSSRTKRFNVAGNDSHFVFVVKS